MQARLTSIAGSRDDLTVERYSIFQSEESLKQWRAEVKQPADRSFDRAPTSKDGASVDDDLALVVDRLRERGLDRILWLDLSSADQIPPPIRQGDVLRALAGGVKRIGIIDGYFDQVPSVWHKEILLALEEGVIVYGAASMGALRAAELHTFGMIGVGRVFEMYRDGVLDDDDEVALLHSSADDGYRAISEAMVNLRDLVDAAVEKRTIDRATADATVAKLKGLPYPQRSVRKLVELAPDLAGFTNEPRTPLKERDALALLDRMRRNEDAPATQRTHVERTVFLERLRQDAIAVERPKDPEAIARTRELLLHLIAVEHAVAVGAVPTTFEMNAILEDWKKERALATDEDLARFLDARAIDVDRFFDRVREEAAVRRLEIVYASELEARVKDLAREKYDYLPYVMCRTDRLEELARRQ